MHCNKETGGLSRCGWLLTRNALVVAFDATRL